MPDRPFIKRRHRPAFVDILTERKPQEKYRSLCHGYSRWLVRYSGSFFLKGFDSNNHPANRDIISQAKLLCRDYVYNKLRRNGLLTSKLEVNAPRKDKTSPVSLEIQMIGDELEKMYPNLYQNVSKQLGITMTSPGRLRQTYLSVSDAMFKHGVVTWGRVVAVFAVGAGLATDCIQQGHSDFVETIDDIFADITAKHLAGWIARQGGWNDVLRAFRTSKEAATLWALTGLGAVVGFLCTFFALVQI